MCNVAFGTFELPCVTLCVCFDNELGSSQAAQMLNQQQQKQQQFGVVSCQDMETLVASLASSIEAASASVGSSGGNIVDVHTMALACAEVDCITIIGSPEALKQSCTCFHF